MIVVGTDYMQPIGEGLTTYWEWIPSPPPSLSPATSMGESPPSAMNTTTTTDATTAADTNATTATEEEQKQLQQYQRP
jgi:hypothetical protein